MAYFNHTIDGSALDLTHLEPRSLSFYVQKLTRDLTVYVRFSNHCFTCKFDDSRHTVADLIMDHRQRRAYDAERYDLSRRLPTIVDALPGSSVYLTATDRNYVYVATVTTENGQQYPVYFNLRRAPREHPAQLLMMIESAYPVADRRQVLAGTTKISFAVLCAKVYRGERVQPKARR
ncbi:hypothetical protein [Methylobacterium platani]|uniref:Uncharacterized protein n=1 Tax=Methylobacterium platani TaxID=427683 RepID=A0A179S1Q7_9HYPH|nr:hypothetical protein [Methylobacterium platani]OAS15936.1 hypothetical protein A5481_28825 [Methylobacterium platani]